MSAQKDAVLAGEEGLKRARLILAEAEAEEIQKTLSLRGINIGSRIKGFSVRGRQMSGVFKGVKINPPTLLECRLQLLVEVMYKNGNTATVEIPTTVASDLEKDDAPRSV